MVSLILLVFALVLFLIAAANVSLPRINFIAAGLACWAAAELAGHLIK